MALVDLSAVGKTNFNRLFSIVRWATQRPQWLTKLVLTKAFNTQVKMAGTVGIEILETDGLNVTLRLKNKTKAQNHIKGVHAAGMALLAESASGFIFGLHVPDNKLPLLKSMQLEYIARAKGDLIAQAKLTSEQIQQIEQQEKGNINVAVSVTDQEQQTPVNCQMQWAWITKKSK